MAKYWVDSSDEDFKTMELLFKASRYNWSLFLAHLVIEKLLKAIYAYKNEQEPLAIKTHNLIFLAQQTNVEIPLEIKNKLQVINTFNIAARYDDYKHSFAQKCTRKWTELQIKNTREVRNWLKSQIQH